MNEKMKSGKDVIAEFFKEIFSMENADKKTVEVVLSIYNTKGRLSDVEVQNNLEKLLQEELQNTVSEDGQD